MEYLHRCMCNDLFLYCHNDSPIYHDDTTSRSLICRTICYFSRSDRVWHSTYDFSRWVLQHFQRYLYTSTAYFRGHSVTASKTSKGGSDSHLHDGLIVRLRFQRGDFKQINLRRACASSAACLYYRYQNETDDDVTWNLMPAAYLK